MPSVLALIKAQIKLTSSNVRFAVKKRNGLVTLGPINARVVIPCSFSANLLANGAMRLINYSFWMAESVSVKVAYFKS